MEPHPLEIELARLVGACARCAWHGVVAETGDGLGVLLRQRGHAVGVWSHYQGELVFRNIAKWDIVHRVPDAVSACEITTIMAEANDWTAT